MAIRIKICGVKSLHDLEAVLDAGVDAVGLNFVSSSPRYLADLDLARNMMKRLRARNVLGVGVFAKMPLEQISEITACVGLDIVQLHGQEPANWATRLRAESGVKVWKAYRISTAQDLTIVADEAALFDAVLLDSHARDGALGGTGKTFDWSILAAFKRSRPLILAGGLNPDNIHAAVMQVNPDWVDTASGVESAPGQKDPKKVKAFVENAKKS